MKLIYAGSYTSQHVKDSVTNTQVSGRYDYTDALNGEKVAPVDIQTKEELLNLKSNHSNQIFMIRNRGENEYDHLILELESMSDELSKEYIDTVLNELSHPDYTYTKDQKDNKVQGLKSTYYDIHKKPDGTSHVHIYLSNFSTEKKDGYVNVFPSATLNNIQVRINVEEQINRSLVNKFGDNANLLNLQSEKAVVLQNQSSQKAKEIARQISREDFDYEEYAKEEPRVISQTVIEDNILNEEKELSDLVQKIEVKKQVIARMKQFSVISEDNIKLKIENVELISQRDKAVEEKEKTIVESNDLRERIELEYKKILEELQKEKDERQIEVSKKQDNINTLVEDIKNKDKEINDLSESLEIAQQETTDLDKKLNDEQKAHIETHNKAIAERTRILEEHKNIINSKDKTIEDKQETIDNQKLVITAKDENIALQKSQNDLLKEELEKSRKEIENLKAENKKIKEENSIIREIANMAIEKYREATEQLKNVSDKLKNLSVKKVVSGIVEGHKAFKAELEKLDKDTENTKNEIDKVRQMFKDKAKSIPEDNEPENKSSTPKKKL